MRGHVCPTLICSAAPPEDTRKPFFRARKNTGRFAVFEWDGNTAGLVKKKLKNERAPGKRLTVDSNNDIGTGTMKFQPGLFAFVFCLVLFRLGGPPADAIIFYSTGDTTYNTTAPTGDLADSGWQYQGQWGNYLGTPISPKHFITAEHVGGSAGNTFTWNGNSYTAAARYVNSDDDLAVWEIEEVFPDWALLYGATDEDGKDLAVFGRGTQRGEEVLVSGASPTDLRGWKWGTADHVQRWGVNVTAGITAGGTGVGDLIRAAFNRAAAESGQDECHLSVGDSGGGVFIQDGNGVWRLAGINYSVDSYFNTVDDCETKYNAAIFDEGGLYRIDNSCNSSFTADRPFDQPTNFYATRISAHTAWINGIILREDSRLFIEQVDNGMMIHWTGRAGHTYDVEKSTDMVNWSVVDTRTPLFDAPLKYTDTAFSGQAFYRVLDTY